MKLVKIRFTAWREQSPTPRSPALQEQIDACITRISVLSAAATHIKVEQAHADSKMLQKSFTRITADLENIDAARTSLLSAEVAAAKAEARAASEHKKVGTFGYQVFNDVGTVVVKIVDESGTDLLTKAVYAYEIVDTDPPLPAWAKEGKVGR